MMYFIEKYFGKNSVHGPSNGRSITVTVKHMARYAMVVCGLLLAAPAHAQYSSIPKETFEALNIQRSATPKEFHASPYR